MLHLTFKRQALLCLLVAIVAIILAHVTQMGIFHNISWVFYGTIFFIHPTWPKSVDWQDPKKLKRGIRIGAALCILIGLITKFGV